MVGTVVKKVTVPLDLLANEAHSRTQGTKSYIATTVAKGYILGE